MRLLWVSTLFNSAFRRKPARIQTVFVTDVFLELLWYSRAATAGMCSKCYKEQVKVQTAPSPAVSAITEQKLQEGPIQVKLVTSVPHSAAAAAVADSSPSVSPSKPQVDKSRCAECKKKVGLTGIECRCGHVYCGVHRMAEKHACTFDFKSFGRKNIEKANEKVVAQSLGDKL